MPIFKCENPVLDNVMLDLYDLIVEHGGYINDRVTVLEKDGELSILSSLPSENHEILIAIPVVCLPRLEDFVITVHDDKLFADPKSDDVSKSCVMVMALMIEIYNITNKLAKHRETDTWQALRNCPELMKKLFDARSKDPKIIKYYEKYANNEFGELLIETFIGSRALNYQVGGEERSSQCLLPFIDFMNHFYEGYMFQKIEKPDALAVSNFLPIPGSSECFVHYCALDSLDSLMIYGFVDISTPYVRSIPLQFDLNEYSSIQVHAAISQRYSEPLPDSVQDLRTYMPYALGLDDDLMQLSHLIIPGGNAPRALRRVLEFFITSWKPGLRSTVVKEKIIEIENFIINKNIEYYANLASFVDAIDGGDIPVNFRRSLNTLIDLQLNKLHHYQVRMNKLG